VVSFLGASDYLARISFLPFLTDMIVCLTASIGAVFPIYFIRATQAAQERASPGSSRCAKAWKCLISSDFSDTYPAPLSLARFLSPAAAYPVGTSRAAILRAIAPKGRLVRWLHADISQ